MISLLLVDNDVRLLQEMKSFLEEDGMVQAVSITSVVEALDRIRVQQFDAIISEYILQITDGQTFLEILRRSRKNDTPFIFFAKKTGNREVINALNAGATFYVLKGSDPKREFILLKHFIHQAVEQKRIQDALIASEERYRRVVEDQSEFIIRYLPDGTLVFANDAYRRYFEKNPGSLLKKNVFEEISPEYRKVFLQGLQGLTPEHPVNISDFHLTRDDGNVLFQCWNNRAIFDAAGKLFEFQSVGHDITDQKNAENALMQAHKNLNIMNTITRHDILNQLTTVFGFLGLAGETTNDPIVQGFVQKAISAAESIRTQIMFTRDYQAIGSSAPQWQNLEHLIDKSARSLDLNGIEFNCSLPDIWVFADPLIEKVFYNLIENSLRHGGKVSRIIISSVECEDELIVIFEDDGIGVLASAKEKIFRREYFQNTGLGLYLIREILAITNIGIQETGIAGKGVRFEIIIPSGKYGKKIVSDLPATDSV